MNQPLISVVVPFVNHRDFIKKCWDGLAHQNYPALDVILVDNGSSDGSDAIAKDLEANYPGRIRMIMEERKGIPYARNKGLEAALGEYVTFLDVDDQFSPDKLSVLTGILEKYPEAAMAYGQTLRIYVETQRKIIQDWGKASPGINHPPALALDWIRSFYHLPQTGATLIRTAVARSIGGFPVNLLMGNDDVGFHLKIASAYPVAYFPGVAVEYFRHEKSEGARLNEQETVHVRYLDAHLKATDPIGRKFFNQTGDIRLWGLAQRGLFLNYVECRFKKRNRIIEEMAPGNLFTFYRCVIPFYKIMPFNIAHFIYKVLRRFVSFVKPGKYPL